MTHHHHPNPFTPAILGNCDTCGTDVLAGDHLWKQPDGLYACENCDVLSPNGWTCERELEAYDAR